MAKHTTLITLFAFFFCVLLLSLSVVVADSDAEINGDKPSFSVKRILQDSYGLLTGSTKKYLELLGYVVSQAKNFYPPNLDFRRTSTSDEQRLKDAANTEAAEGGGAGEKVKLAAEKSFKSTKGVVEETAKSAANMVGEAVHKTADKVKKKTRSHESQTEL